MPFQAIGAAFLCVVFGVVKPVPVAEIEQKFDIVDTLQNILNTISPSLAPKSVISYPSCINELLTYHTNKPLPEKPKKTDIIACRDYLLLELKNSARTANNNIHNLGGLYERYMERSGEIYLTHSN